MTRKVTVNRAEKEMLVEESAAAVNTIAELSRWLW